ncbi:alpha/beta fold hydrolase [Peribacillus sp. SCS-155]|uniref:alpha/beta fold hydrolase n=1 Tax=Peribacillus sedimenti TaxID=3115297 RepID=UPI003905C85B
MLKHLSGKIDISGNAVYFEQYIASPAAPTLVLLHGFLSSGFSYRSLIPYLRQEYNIVSIDTPPFGQSGKSHRFSYSYKNLASSISIVVQKLGISTCTIVGHSMGGQLGLHIMKNHPSLVNNAVLLCSSGYMSKSSKLLRTASYVPYFSNVVKRRLEKQGVDKNLEYVVYDQGLINDEMREGYLRPFHNDEIFRALSKMIRDREQDLSALELGHISQPCLLIWGRHDHVVPVQVAHRLKRDLPNAELVIMEDAGHLLPEEKPKEVAQLIKGFLREETSKQKKD